EPFARAGVPVGGAFGGVRGIKTADEAAVFGGIAGQPYDPCYHQPCDDLSNVHVRALGEAMRAMAWAVGRFAVDDDLDG
ncbi:M28 family peptidase, partial [Saccharothrix sp. MB29]|nr:M28 family peptidase [Saccharothrix sp. MB29]